MIRPVRYFILHSKTDICHIHGFCRETKSRAVPIRLFDSMEELEGYTGRRLRLCKRCQKALCELDR